MVAASIGGAAQAQSAGPSDPDSPAPLYTINGLAPSKGDNVVLLWDEELLQAIRANPAGTGPTVTARALGVAHTSMFDAWAAYDARAIGTRYGAGLRRQPGQGRDPALADVLGRGRRGRHVAPLRRHHFPSGDLHGRSLGSAIGSDAWNRAQAYIRPFGPGPILH